MLLRQQVVLIASIDEQQATSDCRSLELMDHEQSINDTNNHVVELKTEQPELHMVSMYFCSHNLLCV